MIPYGFANGISRSEVSNHIAKNSINSQLITSMTCLRPNNQSSLPLDTNITPKSFTDLLKFKLMNSDFIICYIF